MRRGVGEDELEEPLNAAVFDTPEDEVEGVIKAGKGFYVFEVEDSIPESVKSLEEAKPEIEPLLDEGLAGAALGEFVADFEDTWRSRTFCASSFLSQRLRQLRGKPRPGGWRSDLGKMSHGGNRVQRIPERLPGSNQAAGPRIAGHIYLADARGAPEALSALRPVGWYSLSGHGQLGSRKLKKRFPRSPVECLPSRLSSRSA